MSCRTPGAVTGNREPATQPRIRPHRGSRGVELRCTHSFVAESCLFSFLIRCIQFSFSRLQTNSLLTQMGTSAFIDVEPICTSESLPPASWPIAIPYTNGAYYFTSDIGITNWETPLLFLWLWNTLGSCWTGCSGVTWKRLLKGKGRQGETRTLVWGGPRRAAGYRCGAGEFQAQPRWQWCTKKKSMRNGQLEFLQSPGERRQAADAAGERVVAGIGTGSAGSCTG